MAQFVTLKKSGPKYGPEKSRVQKMGSLLFKKEETAWPLLFLNNNDPVFCTLRFSGPYFGPDFFKATNGRMFSKQE